MTFVLCDLYSFNKYPNHTESYHNKEENIAKGTTDPGVDYFDQYFYLVGLVWQVWFGRFLWWARFGRFGLAGLVW